MAFAFDTLEPVRPTFHSPSSVVQEPILRPLARLGRTPDLGFARTKSQTAIGHRASPIFCGQGMKAFSLAASSYLTFAIPDPGQVQEQSKESIAAFKTEWLTLQNDKEAFSRKHEGSMDTLKAGEQTLRPRMDGLTKALVPETLISGQRLLGCHLLSNGALLMSDSSQLYFLDRPERPRRTELEEIDSPYLLADWHLPIGWLAMLASSDLRIDSSASRDNEKPYFAVECATAIARLDERLLWLKSAVPGLKTAWFDSFRRFISDSKFRWVHVDPLPISEVIGDDSVAESERLIGLLAAFEELPTPIDSPMKSNSNSHSGWEAYCAHFGKPFSDTTYDCWVACFGASGTEQLAPWEAI